MYVNLILVGSVVKDIVWTVPGVHFVVKQSKTMQAMKEFRVDQLPKLYDSLICPVVVLQELITK